MSTLILDRKGLRLKRESRTLVVYQDDRRTGTLPLGMLERVVVRANVQLDTGVLGALGEAGVGLLVFGGRGGRRQALFGMPAGGDARRRLHQARAHDDTVWRDRFSWRIVRHKVLGQRRLLGLARQARPDLRRPLGRGLETLDGILAQLSSPLDRARLRGLEGAAAAAHFAAYTRLFAPALGFDARRRRPPPDPVNATLSLAYTLLHFEAVSALLAAGLDPYIGFFHDLAHGRESLASDLIEPLRPRVDRWVWQLFRDERLRAAHFHQEQGGMRLGKAGRGIFHGAYEAWAGPHRRALGRGVRHLLRALEEHHREASER